MRARHADIAQAALLLEPVKIVDRALVREQAILHAAHEHQRKLQALGRVQRHHLHAILPGLRLALARFEHRVRQETPAAAAGSSPSGSKPRAALTSSSEVLDARLAAIGLVALVMIEQAAGLDHVIDLLVQRQVLRSRAPRRSMSAMKPCTAAAAFGPSALRLQRCGRSHSEEPAALRLLADACRGSSRRCRAAAGSPRARRRHRRGDWRSGAGRRARP